MAALVSASSSTEITYEPLETPVAVLATPLKTFQITALEDTGELIKLQRVVREWVDIMSERLGHSRANKLSNPKNFEQDLEKFEDFRKVRDFVDLGIDRKIREVESPNMREPVVIAVIKDQDGMIQGISTSTIKADEIYLNALLSAPWNLLMHGPVDDDHRSLRVKGAGTYLMAYNYRLAQRLQKPILSLSPLDDALGFYIKIGMQERGKQFVFDVSDQAPERLNPFLPTDEEQKSQCP